MIDLFREEPALYGSLGGLGLFVILWGSYAMVQDEGPAPPPPPPPPTVEHSAAKHIRFTKGYYRALLQEDAKTFGLGDFDVRALLAPHRYLPEFRGSHKLTRRRPTLKTDHLEISVRSERIWVGAMEAGFRADHQVLRIENRSDKHLAYAVETKLTDAKGCKGKGDMPHNALAVKPREAIERTECLFSKWNELRVVRVNVLEITPLGYYYVSRLSPMQLGLDPRTGGGHTVPSGAQVCQHVPREVRDGLMSGTLRWEDVMDFYARHNCDEYWFFERYRLRDRAATDLKPERDKSKGASAGPLPRPPAPTP